MPSDLASSSWRRWVTTTAKMDSLIPGSALCERLVGRDLQPVLFQHFADVPRGVLTLVRAHHVFDAAGLADNTVVDPHRRLAQPGEELVGVAGEERIPDRSTRLCSRVCAFLRKSASTAPMPSSSSRISGSMLVTTPSASRTRMPVE